MARAFLTARWEHLVFLSYRCPPALLAPHVPAGTDLDPWNGDLYVSLVAFLFRDTRLRGLPIPFHRTFEEVNLRFYVRRTTTPGEVRRAVVFLRELVPRRAIAAVARRAYNEPYLAVPMGHDIHVDGSRGGTIGYSWRHRGHAFAVRAAVRGSPALPAHDSLATFITEHYWGYTRQKDGGALEYEVQHPQWPVWVPEAWALEGSFGRLYGEAFGRILACQPDSVLAAEGSQVSVLPGVRTDPRR